MSRAMWGGVGGMLLAEHNYLFVSNGNMMQVRQMKHRRTNWSRCRCTPDSWGWWLLGECCRLHLVSLWDERKVCMKKSCTAGAWGWGHGPSSPSPWVVISFKWGTAPAVIISFPNEQAAAAQRWDGLPACPLGTRSALSKRARNLHRSGWNGNRDERTGRLSSLAVSCHHQLSSFRVGAAGINSSQIWRQNLVLEEAGRSRKEECLWIWFNF